MSMQLDLTLPSRQRTDDRNAGRELDGLSTREFAWSTERHAAYRASVPPPAAGSEEALVLDARAQMRPCQLVEHKLISLLKTALLPVSHVRASSVRPERRSH
jgi:hypothetical protein